MPAETFHQGLHRAVWAHQALISAADVLRAERSALVSDGPEDVADTDDERADRDRATA
jgi:hypothetical protein